MLGLIQADYAEGSSLAENVYLYYGQMLKTPHKLSKLQI